MPAAAPKLLWTNRNISGSQSGSLTDGGPVLSNQRLAFSSGDWVYFLSENGSDLQKVKFNAMAAYPSALVADTSGNVYYSAPDGVYAVDAAGSLRWSQAGAGSGGNAEFSTGYAGVLGPDGVVYFAGSGQSVSAYQTNDGKLLWSHAEPANQNITLARMVGGGGKAVFAAYEGVYPDAHTSAIDTRNGTVLGSFIRSTYGASFTWGWTTWIEGWDLGIACDLRYVFDTCGQQKLVTVAPASRSGIIAAGERVVLVTNATASGAWTQVALYDTNGTLVAGPASAEGQPIAAGADGTIYTYNCQSSAPVVNRILAYSYELQELWRFDLGGKECRGITGNVILDDDGVMYLTRVADGGLVEADAIQTASPGLAESSWPSLRHDNRGTAWLVSGTPAVAASDGGSGDAIDAPLPSGVDN